MGNTLPMFGIAEDDILVMTIEGKVIRIRTTQVRPLGRSTQGVRIIQLDPKDRVCSIAKVDEE